MVGSGLALSACLPSNGICRLYLRRRSALSIAHAAWDRRSAAKSRDFAEVAICASLPFVISAANFRFPPLAPEWEVLPHIASTPASG